jgi:trehalose-phosphatase
MIFLMLDYDGTLAPVVSNPDRARIKMEMKVVLSRLAQRDDMVMAVISGRSLGDLKSRVRLDSIYYAGCHGFEMEGPGWSYQHPKMKQVAGQVDLLEKYLNGLLSGIKGCIIENKSYALTVHFRKVKPDLYPAVERAVRQAEKKYTEWMKMEPGRMIYEFKPSILWDKGRAVEMLLGLYQAYDPYPIYIGDDITDEPAFRFLRHSGLTVLVENNERPQTTAAVLRLHSIDQVLRFLKSLL